MSKIEELIAKHCPDGVEYKELGELAGFIRGLTYNKQNEDPNGQIKVLRANSINHLTNTLNLNDVKKLTIENKNIESKKIKTDDILICIGSGSKNHIGKVAYIFDEIDYYFGGFMAVVRSHDGLNSRFLFHLLVGENFNLYLDRALSSTTINNLNSRIMNKYIIPVPPMEVQLEIVNILDKFTELAGELEAELELRQRQCEFYRTQFLKMQNDDSISIELWKIADYSRTKISVKDIDTNRYVGVDNLLQNKQGKSISKYLPLKGKVNKYNQGDILLGNIRPYLKKIWLADNDGGASSDVLVVKINGEYKDKILSNFLFNALAADSFFSYNSKYSKGAKMPRGNKDKIMEYKVPVPPLEEQERIVNILDKFDKLTNDISEGLPAEIAARKKQYEYYRNKLLTFKELKK